MRTKNFTSVLVILTSLVLMGASCGQKAAVTTNVNVTTPTNQVTTSPKTSDTCGNPYYPFKQGLTIAYGVTPTTGAAGDSDYKYRIASVLGTTASIQVEMAKGGTVDMTADCASGSVALKGSSDLGAALEGVKFKTTVLSSTGTYMPANVAAGSIWSNSETVKMEITGDTSAAALGPIEVTTAEQSKAIGEESVKVQAGTYTAMKVEVTRTSTSKFSGGSTGIKLPEMPPTISKSTEWWVKGIGMIKTVTITDGKTSTTEAKSVSGN